MSLGGWLRLSVVFSGISAGVGTGGVSCFSFLSSLNINKSDPSTIFSLVLG